MDPASVLDVRQLIADLRQAGQSRGLLDAVYNRLADEQQLADPDLTESLEQMRRGEYENPSTEGGWPQNSRRRESTHRPPITRTSRGVDPRIDPQ
jgi:hypothetical protein